MLSVDKREALERLGFDAALQRLSPILTSKLNVIGFKKPA
jgi:hypothetical protein